uniref:Steroid sulfatase (microsomal), isozyme S n=1 Tax=Oncorhynchus kisutch TaxID=8019 RepID=A0A8C7LT00_ONCKI
MRIPCCLDLLLLFDVCYALNGDKRPYFVLIMVDDLAIVDSGNTTLTPNIDMLAQEGLRLTQRIAAAPLCTPSRAGVYIISAASGGLPKEEVTFAKVAKRQGYEIALIGKWHRGLNCERNDDYCHHPSAHGFHHFYGITLTKLRDCQPGRGSIFTNVQTLGVGVATVTFLHARGVDTAWRELVLRVVALVGAVAAIYGTFVANFPDFSCFLMRNREVDEQPYVSENLTQRMTDEAQNSALPFLLFFSFIQVHMAMFASPAFQGNSQHDIYGNAIQEVDWNSGPVEPEGELVYLTSDQLAHIEEITKGTVCNSFKRTGQQRGEIQVPVLLRWTGMLLAGKDIDEPTSNMDIFPTVMKLAGGTALGDRWGKVERSKHDFLFHYCNAYLNVVRWQPPNSYSKWKVFFFTPDFYPENGTACMHTHACFCTASYMTYHDPPLLFDLSYTEPAFHSVVEEIRVAVAVHKESITPVQDQLAPGHLLWKPCLQPCCSSLSQLCRYERDGGRDGQRSTAAADSPQDQLIIA